MILSLEESPDLDTTALEALAEFCTWFSSRGGELRLPRLKENAREALARARVRPGPLDDRAWTTQCATSTYGSRRARTDSDTAALGVFALHSRRCTSWDRVRGSC